MDHTADTIIIGGGVQGASLAFHLAQRGLRPMVLEKKFVGAGATGRSSGLVRMHYDTEVDARLAWVSFDYFQNWKEMVGGDSGFTRTGFLQIVGDKHYEALKQNTTMLQSIGIPTWLISSDDVARLCPHFYTDDFAFAAYEPESGYAMPSDTANSLMNAARRHGARLVQDCLVSGVIVAGGRVTGVESSRGTFHAPVVVNCAGAWAEKFNKMVGLELPYDTWRHDTMFVMRPKQAKGPHPATIDFRHEMYFRSEGELTLVGLEDNNPLGESPDNESDHALPGFVDRAVDRICQRMPVLEHGGLHSAHGGYDGITPDQHPIIGAAGPDGFILNCGHSGTGFKTAPAVGKCLTELIVDGAVSSVDISSLAPSRFEEGKLIGGTYDNIWT